MFFNVTITYKLSPAVPVQIHKIIMLILTTPEKKGRTLKTCPTTPQNDIHVHPSYITRELKLQLHVAIWETQLFQTANQTSLHQRNI